MSQLHNLAIIVGSLRKASINLKLAKAVAQLGQGRFNSRILRIDDLPLYNQDLESDFPQTVTRFKDELKSSDAVLIVTPEYNRSIPGPLKNALDWASRPYGTNSFARKPTGLMGASAGATGTACAQHSLHPVLAYLDVRLMSQPEVYLQFTKDLIDAEGNISNDSTKKFLQGYIDQFADFVNDI